MSEPTQVDNIGCGFLIGVVVTATITISTLFGEPDEIQSPTRIEPEKTLTTDGKKVDTLYTYRRSKN